MRILTITAQKLNSTGSGFYLTELVKAFSEEGHEQAALAGIYQEDKVELPEGVKFFPVYFKTEELPFPIAESNEELHQCIKSFEQKAYKKKVTDFLDFYGVHEDGHASERAAKFIISLLKNTNI